MTGRKVGEVFVEVRANLSKLKSGMKSAMKIAGGGASVIGRILGGLANLIKNALGAAFKIVGAVIKTIFNLITTLFSAIIKWAKRGVLALSAFVALSIVVGAKFGQSMARVKALTGATTQEFKALRTEARRLGRATEYSANEAADAMSIFAMAGFNTNDIITAMTPTLDFAAASGLALADAADIAARVMGGMQLSASDLEHTMDVLTKAFTSANMDARDLGEAMKFVGAVGRTVGKGVEELVGALTALAQAGNRGSMAGTGLRKVLMGLATSKIQKRLAKLGISVTDTAGAMKPISKIVGDIGKATKKMSDMEIADLGVQMFGARGGVAFLQLLGQGEAAIEKYTKQLENVNNFTKKIAATQRDTLATSFKIVQSAIADVMITITDIMEPTMQGAADSQVKMWNKIGEVLEAQKSRIQNFLKVTIAWLKNKIPAAIQITLGALITLFNKVKENFASLLSIGKTASGLFGDFFEVKSLKGTVFDKVIQAAGIAFIKIKNMLTTAFKVIMAQVELIMERINTTMNEQRWGNKFSKMWGVTKKVAKTVGSVATQQGRGIGDIWGEETQESADVTAGRAREKTISNELARAKLGTTQEKEDKEIAKWIESVSDPTKGQVEPKTFSIDEIAQMTKDEIKDALQNVASQYKPDMDKVEKEQLDLTTKRLYDQFTKEERDKKAAENAARKQERQVAKDARIKEFGISPLDVFDDEMDAPKATVRPQDKTSPLVQDIQEIIADKPDDETIAKRIKDALKGGAFGEATSEALVKGIQKLVADNRTEVEEYLSRTTKEIAQEITGGEIGAREGAEKMRAVREQASQPGFFQQNLSGRIEDIIHSVRRPQIGDLDFMDTPIDFDEITGEKPKDEVIVTGDIEGATLVEGFAEKGKAFLENLGKVFLPKEREFEIPRPFWVGPFLLDLNKVMPKIKKGVEWLKSDKVQEHMRKWNEAQQPKLEEGREIALPQRLAAFTTTISTVIGTAKVGVSEQLVWLRDTAETNRAILEEVSKTADTTASTKIITEQLELNSGKSLKELEDLAE